MKFTEVTFEEDSNLNTRGETYDFNKGETRGFPKPKAEALAFGNLSVELGEEYEVPDEEVSERFAEEVDGDSEEDKPASEAYLWLEDATVEDVENSVQDIVENGTNSESSREEDLMYLNDLAKAEAEGQERKGALSAIGEAQDEIEKKISSEE